MSIKTEKEKMLAGERYNCLDPELEADRQKAKILLRRYNQAEGEPERQTILHDMLGSVGQNVTIWQPFFCIYGRNIHLGDFVFINTLCTILDGGQVWIGNHVMIGPSVQIYTAAHDLQAATRIQGFEIVRPIIIEQNVWIGGGAIILPGVTIRQNAVVGAGSVVRRNIPANTIVAGNPAVVVRKIVQ